MNDKAKGIIGTVFFHALVLVCLIFFFSFKTKLPLPEEEGVELGTEVNLGNSEQGFGEIQSPELSDNIENVTKSTPTPAENLSQSTEETPLIENTSKKPTKEKAKEPEKPVVNQNALYKGKSKSSSNQGIAGGKGDQGKPGGDPNSNNYVGSPGTGGIGIDLKGRKYMYLQSFKNPTDEEGKVVVSITVDKLGKVTKAVAGVKGSTISNQVLWKTCQNAALQSVFDANPNAEVEQKGTITYIFLKLN